MRSTIRYISMSAMLLWFVTAYAHVQLDYPNGGESFQGGTMVQIQWHTIIQHDQNNWDLYFSPDGGTSWEVLQENIPVAITYYDWTVPEMNTTQGQIMIIQDNNGQNYQDLCSSFSITSSAQPPVINIPAQDITVSCGSSQNSGIQSWLDSHGGALGTVFCGEGTWSNDYAGLSDGCGASGSANVTFSFADGCANVVTTSATVIVEDNTPPVLDPPPSDVTVDCVSNVPSMIQLGWTDACDGSGAVAGADVSDGLSCPEVITRTWSYTDACGNPAAAMTQTITVEDNTAPVILQNASHLSLECDGNGNQNQITNWLANNGGASASDNCSNVIWSNNYSALSDGCGPSGIAQVAFTATDACGNSSMTFAILSVGDNTPPQIQAVARDTVIKCMDGDVQNAVQGWLNNSGGARAYDVCGTVVWSNDYEAPAQFCDATQQINVVFEATDDCGNASTTAATVKIEEETTGSADLDQEMEIQVFPNPASERLNITFPDNADRGISLFDMQGRNVWQGHMTGKTMVLYPGLVHGAYLLVVKSSDRPIVRQVLIQ